MLMVLVIIGIAVIGYCLGKAFRSHMKNQRKALLLPPIDLFEDADNISANSNFTDEIKKKHS